MKLERKKIFDTIITILVWSHILGAWITFDDIGFPRVLVWEFYKISGYQKVSPIFKQISNNAKKLIDNSTLSFEDKQFFNKKVSLKFKSIIKSNLSENNKIIKYKKLVALVKLETPQQQYFKGYKCKKKCRGHKVGYSWAEENDVIDAERCDVNSNSFYEGCIAYVDEILEDICTNDMEDPLCENYEREYDDSWDEDRDYGR